MRQTILILLTSLATFCVSAQQATTIFVMDSLTGKPVPQASIAVKGIAKTQTDSSGNATLLLTNGPHNLQVSSIGYFAQDIIINIPGPKEIVIKLLAQQKAMDEVVVVSSTRNNQRIENAPMKVEVLGREEMAEENTIKPANIASILGDISGIQIQQSSATSGNAGVRIQGLDGRYTQILRDGLPLYDGFSGGFGILSIPPLDLKQVELIKGSASTLYGGGAIGGLVNIISRTPIAKQEAVLTLNHSTLNESNINTYIAKRNKKTGYTFFGGYTYQKQADVNKDGFSDVPKLNTLVLHPRLFFYPSSKTTISTGYTATFENRNGGDMMVLDNKPDATHQYFEQNKTSRHSGELMVSQKLSGDKKFDFKGSISSFGRKIFSSTSLPFDGNQKDFYTEASLFVPYKTNSLVAGINFTGSSFAKNAPSSIPLQNCSNNTVGAFAQNTWIIKEKTTLEAGLRGDHTDKYGNFFLPRLAIFHRFDEHWATRAGVGLGYKIPNVLAPQVVDYPMDILLPIGANTKAEKSVGYNAEVNYKTDWGENNIFINHAFFLTQLNNPLVASQNSLGYISFANAGKPVVSKGFDTYVRAAIQEWELYAGYTYTIAERQYEVRNQFVPLTPKNRWAFTLVRDWEKEGFRFGLEGSFNGPEYRFDATKTPGYFFAAAMVEKKFGKHISMVLNGENLLDYRQSKHDALYRGSITNPEFVPLWAPIDGRVFNCSLKWKL